MNSSSTKINILVEEISKRWKKRALKQGISIMVISMLFFVLLIALLNLRFDLSPLAQRITLSIALLGILFETVQFILRPVLQKISHQKIALFIEEKIPELEDRLNSAVEIVDQSDTKQKTILLDKLIDDARQKTKELEISTFIDVKKVRILSYAAYAFLLLFFILSYSFKDDVQLLISKIGFNFGTTADFATIMPGNIQIEKGESKEITAEMNISYHDDIFLHYKIGDEVWRRELMERAADKPRYMYPILNIQEPVRYFIETQNHRSAEYLITIYEFPRVDRIDLEYSYPSYTGILNRVEEQSGNIRGLNGSKVNITVMTTGTVVEGEMIINDSLKIPLIAKENGILYGEFILDQQGVYYIDLTDNTGQHNKFPEIYQITAVHDELPLITITDPQRDIRVNAVEEVLISSSVTDDFGIKNVQLKYSVNGAEDKTINLFTGKQQQSKDISESVILYLEDYALEEGDIISYYIEANDYSQRNQPAATDMYFIEIMPFDVNYSQVNNQSGGGMSGMQRSGSSMVVNQQMIISATWKLIRKKKDMPSSEIEESTDALIQAQSNLRNNIANRVNSTAFSFEMVLDEENKEMANLLREAINEMDLAVQELSKNQLQQALKPEQKALSYMLKVDAKNREKRVQQGRQLSAGRGSPSEERMTELMDLELDISKDKYEIQQGSSQQQNEEVNNALQKVKDLAKKQQALAERNRNNIQQQENRRSLDRLKRDQEQLRHETEELAREMRRISGENQQISRQLREQIERITETMRQAEQELNRNNIQQSLSKQQQAINELDKLQQHMHLSASNNAREILENFRQTFKQFRDQEHQLANDLNDTYDKAIKNNGKLPNLDVLKNIIDQRKNAISRLEDLNTQAKMIEEQTVQENPATSTNMRNVQNAIKREDLDKKMEKSQSLLEYGYLSYAKSLEDYILYSMDVLEDQVRQLEEELPVTEQEKLTRSLDETRQMLNDYEDLLAKMKQEANPNDRNEQANNSGASQQQHEARNGSQGNNENTLRMQHLNDQLQRMLERMENDFQGDHDLRQTVESFRRRTVSQMTGELLSGNVDEYFKQHIYNPLSQLELQLMDRLDAIDLGKKLHVTHREEVSPEYKRMVEKYFESISKTK